MGELGEGGLFRNKVWTKENESSASAVAAAGSAASDQQHAAVAALSFTLPSTPPSLKGQAEPQQQEFASLTLPPAGHPGGARGDALSAVGTAATAKAPQTVAADTGEIDLDGDGLEAAAMAEDISASA